MDGKINVGLVQINNSFANQNYLPYSVGLLQSYAQRYLSDKGAFNFLLPIYKRIPIEEVEQRLLDADIVFFSTYMWNIKISLEIAKRMKKNKPEILIVFGGPEVPNKNSEGFLQKHRFINIACHEEGEKTFLSILENYATNNWEKVPSISYVDEKGSFFKTPIDKRIRNLDEIPSPYTNGVFEQLIKANSEEEWIALWESNRGCPFSCSYCVWGAFADKKVYSYSIERLYEEIEWFSKHKIQFVYCCDANFGILPRDIDIVKHFAEAKKKYHYPQRLSVQNTKNTTARLYDMYKILSKHGLSKGVSLSLQSINKETLKKIRRQNISAADFQRLQRKFNTANIETFTDIILGLPCETYQTFTQGISSVMKSGQHDRIQFINLTILTNSEMDEPAYQKRHGFDIVKTKIINIHGRLSDKEELSENQKLVIATNTMPRADWVKARVFSWMTSLLYFDKLLQIPFVILHRIFSIDFKELIEVFSNGAPRSPILREIHSFFVNKATDIQNGGSEYCQSEKWLNIWWPADELMLIKLCTEDKLDALYKETEQAITNFLHQTRAQDFKSIFRESILLNQNLIKLPFKSEDSIVQLSHNIWDFYRAALRGDHLPLKEGDYQYLIQNTNAKWSSWEDWCREMVWYENKKGAYLYPCKRIRKEYQTHSL